MVQLWFASALMVPKFSSRLFYFLASMSSLYLDLRWPTAHLSWLGHFSSSRFHQQDFQSWMMSPSICFLFLADEPHTYWVRHDSCVWKDWNWPLRNVKVSHNAFRCERHITLGWAYYFKITKMTQWANNVGHVDVAFLLEGFLVFVGPLNADLSLHWRPQNGFSCEKRSQSRIVLYGWVFDAWYIVQFWYP